MEIENSRTERGTVLLESLICLPVLLLAALGVGQFAHIWYCRQIVRYAAFCGARAALTAAPGTELDQAREAVRVVCAPLAFFNPTGESDFSVPGVFNNAKIPSSGAVRIEQILRTEVSMDEDGFHCHADVRMKIPLMFPIAGPVIGRVMQLYSPPQNGYSEFSPGPSPEAPLTDMISGDLFPRAELRENVYMAKPFRCTWPTN